VSQPAPKATETHRDLIGQLEAAMGEAISWSMADQKPEGYWVGHLQSNSCMEAQWILALHFMGLRDHPQWEGLVKSLLREQRPDGSWGIYHGAPAGDVPADRFVGFVQNHDQVGNRAGGERLASLVDPPRLRLAAALLLLAPQIPLLFMGEEWGETAPFLYFVDHGDPALLEAVRRGRRREFAAFHAGGAVPDPADPATFARSRPDRTCAASREGAALRALYAELLAARRALPALRPGAARAEVGGAAEAGWIELRLAPGAGEPALALFGIDAAPARARIATAGGPWRRVLDTEDERFRGSGASAPARLTGEAADVVLPAYGAWLYAREAA